MARLKHSNFPIKPELKKIKLSLKNKYYSYPKLLEIGVSVSRLYEEYKKLQKTDLTIEQIFLAGIQAVSAQMNPNSYAITKTDFGGIKVPLHTLHETVNG